jgi:eukaryotic-like serine/threonine-protein kinase
MVSAAIDDRAREAPPAPSGPREGSQAKLQRLLSGDLDTIALRALHKEPQRRYASVEQFAEDIRRHLQGLPVTARRDSWSYRAGKFAVRHKLGVAASALIVIAVLGGVVATVREARIAAANERQAEQRFNDVRKLANSLMFEIHDSIVDLPGATPARKLIVQRSLEYLDGLSQEATGDLSLQRELANAYERIGLVQGDPSGSNLGDIAGASASFAKALSIRERITKTKSVDNPADSVALAESYRETCALKARYLANVGAALDDCGKAVSQAEGLYRTDPSNGSVETELAKAYESIGNVYGQGSTNGNAGDSFAAMGNHRKALDLVAALAKSNPGDLDLNAWQGRLGIQTADDLFEVGRVSQAVVLYQQSTQTLESLANQSSKPSYRASLLLAYQRRGDMLLVTGRFEPALVYYRKQLAGSEELAAADPKNMSFRTNVTASLATYGHALWRSGHVTRGIAALQQGLADVAETKQQDSRSTGLEATLRLWLGGALEKQDNPGAALLLYLRARNYFARICESDPRDVEDCLSLAGTQDRIARVHIRQGHLEEARSEYEKALSITEPLAAGDKPNLEAVYTVVNLYYGMGEVNRSLRQPSCDWYAKSYAAFRRIPEWLPITPNEFDSRDPKQIGARLSTCPPLADSGSR